MLLHTHPELRVQYDDELSLLRTTATGGCRMSCLQAYANHFVTSALCLQVRRYMLVLDAMPDIPVADQLWLGTDWLPRATALPIERVVLLFNNQSEYNRMAVDSLLTMGRAAFRFELQFFADSKSGLRWLTDDSPRVPALLAEWEAACAAPAGRRPDASRGAGRNERPDKAARR